MSKFIATGLVVVTIWQDPAGLYWVLRYVDMTVGMIASFIGVHV